MNSVSAQNTWSRYYNITSDGEKVDVLIPYRQGYLVGSNVFCSPSTLDGCTFFMYINKNGDILKDTILTVGLDSSIEVGRFNSSIVNNDSSFVFAMYSNYTPTLMKFDTSFKITKFHKYYSTKYILNLRSVFKIQDNRYLYFNTTADKIVNTKQRKIWLILTDSSFNQIKQYGQIGSDTFFIIDYPHFEMLKDGSFAVAFQGYLKGQKLNENHYVCLMKFDSLGTVLWSKIYGPPPYDDFNYTATIVKQLNNGNIVFSGALENYTSVLKDGEPNYLQCASLTGDSLWRSYFNYENCSCKKRIFNLAKSKNGDILGVGFGISFKNNSLFKGWVFCMSPGGKLKWERFYSYKDTLQNVTFNTIHCDIDGSIMIGSYIDDGIPKNPGLWILRLDSMGCMSSDCSGTELVTAIKEVKNGYEELREVFFSLSPNPAYDIVNINYFSRQPERKISFNLFDNNGKLLEVIDASDSIENYTMPVRNLPNGTYVVNMLMNGNVVQTEKLIISR
ncbi:MAG TPA: T9SS type A sorting domain-containing protein [Saprospiraceae bacterium]|nr:T9SS type A sorting domain-containing protein [Saprospiraceae bacterium]